MGKKMGRPSLKTPELLDEICELIMSGKNLVQIANLRRMPSRDSIHTWLGADTNFSDRYARACKIRREAKFYEIEQIAKREPDVQRARLMIDVTKWQLSKEDPKIYGDKVDVTSDGRALPTPLLGGMAYVSDHASNDQAPQA